MKYQMNFKDVIVELKPEEIQQYITYRLSNDFIVSTQALEIIKVIYQHIEFSEEY